MRIAASWARIEPRDVGTTFAALLAGEMSMAFTLSASITPTGS
jgi:hypothetical protein